MKILILGAGTVGTSVASALASENNDITVVDVDTMHLRELAEKLDLHTVQGHGSHPSYPQSTMRPASTSPSSRSAAALRPRARSAPSSNRSTSWRANPPPMRRSCWTRTSSGWTSPT